jgi:predicted dinucleotide-utilizing enzyme
MNINIAIIGLGRVGSILLQQLNLNRKKGINILAVSELENTPGRIYANQQNIRIMSMEDIAKQKEKIDIIFELTGNQDVRKQLRNLMSQSNNNHTTIATEIMGTLICSLFSDKMLPDVHKHKGY